MTQKPALCALMPITCAILVCACPDEGAGVQRTTIAYRLEVGAAMMRYLSVTSSNMKVSRNISTGSRSNSRQIHILANRELVASDFRIMLASSNKQKSLHGPRNRNTEANGLVNPKAKIARVNTGWLGRRPSRSGAGLRRTGSPRYADDPPSLSFR